MSKEYRMQFPNLFFNCQLKINRLASFFTNVSEWGYRTPKYRYCTWYFKEIMIIRTILITLLCRIC